MKSRYFILAASLGVVMASCDDVLEAGVENSSDMSVMYQKPTYAQKLFGNAYVLIPTNGTPSSDLGTDDLLSNDPDNDWRKMSTGGWSSSSNPVSSWRSCYHAIQYLNIIIENADLVPWNQDKVRNQMYIDLFKGQSYAMRGMFHYYLLRSHAGYVNGVLMGVPLHLSSETGASDFNQHRNTFAECLDQIYADFAEAKALLPEKYGDLKSDDAVPSRYRELAGGSLNKGELYVAYNYVFGNTDVGMVDYKIIDAIKSQLDLMAASPAFEAISWDAAAKSCAEVLNRVGGLSHFDSNGNTWYCNDAEIEDMGAYDNPDEILWKSGKPGIATGQNNDYPIEHFAYPPSLEGQGSYCPTQNLVDAFPMKNGYPITNSASGYNAKKPYEGRDPRLNLYIVVNGSQIGPDAANANDKVTYIDVTDQSTTYDAIGVQNGKSTRTGYYMRKHTNKKTILGANKNWVKHYTARIRYTEMYLNYAEAANEAYGPTADGGAGCSAYDVIKAIRKRAGIDSSDKYLESIKGDKDAMRQLIRNERRLELCFENKRFYDLRRWKSDLSVAVNGVHISKSGSSLSYSVFAVDQLKFDDYMYYGPIDYSETQKYNNLEQNDGWE